MHRRACARARHRRRRDRRNGNCLLSFTFWRVQSIVDDSHSYARRYPAGATRGKMIHYDICNTMPISAKFDITRCLLGGKSKWCIYGIYCYAKLCHTLVIYCGNIVTSIRVFIKCSVLNFFRTVIKFFFLYIEANGRNHRIVILFLIITFCVFVITMSYSVAIVFNIFFIPIKRESVWYHFSSNVHEWRMSGLSIFSNKISRQRCPVAVMSKRGIS